MVLNTLWTPNLGVPRVQIDLAKEFQAMGHKVEKFDLHDAFGQVKPSVLADWTRPSFSVKAKAFVQANAHRFDIIEAIQGKLPFSKEELGFGGLLVARSVGLRALLDEFIKLDNIKWPPKNKKTAIANWLRSLRHKREKPDHLRSFQTCDLINLPNCDELAYVRDFMGEGDKCVVFPLGLSQQRQQQFVREIESAVVRLANKQVVFIGAWGPRKGSRDWSEIIKRVRAQVQEARFLFLGTGFSAEVVLEDINLPSSYGIEIVERYDSEELPRLLSGATVGAFPSYMEGFGLAVLEKLASGLPTVAYDIPGPREMLRYLDEDLRVPAGNVLMFSSQLVKLLKLEEVGYSRLSRRCMEVANLFSWEKIARETLDVYAQKLASIR